MKKLLLILLSALTVHFSSAQQQPDNSLAAGFDKILSGEFGPDGSGATAIVARNGRIIYQKAFGKANLELHTDMQVDNVFRIGSLTKQFTAVAILQLAERGKLDLQDTITRFLPDYPMQAAKISIEHLLTHTSGIRNYTSIKDYDKRAALDVTPAEMIGYFKSQPLRFAPGTRWEYSNSNYFLLGQIIEKASGMTYAAYLEENIFKPAGMTASMYATDKKIIPNRASGYTSGEKGIENAPYISMTQPYAAGAILSTAGDLYKWNAALHSNKLLKKESLEKAFRRYKLADGQETAYGYGWRFGYIQGSPSRWHGGLISGFISFALYLPQEDVFVAVLSNCDCKSPEDVTSRLAALAIGKPYEYKPVALPTDSLQGYTGVYENGKGQTRVLTVTGNRLSAQAGRGKKSPLQAYQVDNFYFEDDKLQSAGFSRSSTGAITQMIIHSRTANEVWRKTGKPIPGEDGIQLDENVLDTYVGTYAVSPDFSFAVSRVAGKLFLQARGQDKLELFAEEAGKFFLKVNDAQLHFVADPSGKVTKALLFQGGRSTEARRTE